MIEKKKTKKKPVKKNYVNTNKKKKDPIYPVLPDLWPNGKFGAIEYHMPEEEAKDLLKSRKGADLKMDAQAYLCKYVDEQCGLMYRCVRVVFS